MNLIFLKKESLVKILCFAFFISIAVFCPLLKNKYVVGTLINAALFLSVTFLGIRSAVLVGIIPSLIAVSTGLVPVYFAVFIPVIMLANILLVSVFGFVKFEYLKAVFFAAFFKAVFLSCIGFIIVLGAADSFLAKHFFSVMGMHQFVTAGMGGILSFSILKYLKIKN